MPRGRMYSIEEAKERTQRNKRKSYENMDITVRRQMNLIRVRRYREKKRIQQMEKDNTNDEPHDE